MNSNFGASEAVGGEGLRKKWFGGGDIGGGINGVNDTFER